ncbi:MAG: S46 family peptidase [Flavobacteriales bacterium]|jgi:hypothetical protein|nr:S46 family peptidase [Flavobacteriales bacterium]
MKKNSLKQLLVLAMLTCGFSLPSFADEGMWIPLLLEKLNEAEMQDMGMELSAEDIYSINKSSLKDAIVHFNGGCTSEIISKEGLLLTNHHCGYGQIQNHSSVEHDYLKDGFWAKTRADELPNDHLSATFIKKIEDVSQAALEGVTDGMDEAKRNQIIRENIKKIKAKATEGTSFGATIKPFYKGNQYYLFLTETFTDIRLVGAPPSSIGKYGADTDNWMWPRHTGDFSIFRIYANKDNKPADFSKDNVPYKPAHSLPVSIKGLKEGDFTMVFGFPGRTDEYLPSYEIEQVLNILNPAKIEIRKTALEIIDNKMRSSQKIKIQYAAKQSSISNGYKKWIGESKGMKAVGALDKKMAYEKDFLIQVKGGKEFNKYRNVLSDLKKLYDQKAPLILSRRYFIETNIVTVSSQNKLWSKYRQIEGYNKLEDKDKKKEKAQKLADSWLSDKKYWKDLDNGTDREVLAAVLSLNVKNLKEGQYPAYFKELYDKHDGNLKEGLRKAYAKSYFMNEEKFRKALEKNPVKAIKKFQKDPLYLIAKAGGDFYLNEIGPKYNAVQREIDKLMRTYMKAQMEVFSGKRFYPDANGTMRVSYGKVEGVSPKDAVTYAPYTYMEGLMAKYVPGDYEFDLPTRLIELYENKDYGVYADKNGKMPVCFIASNHTTGGNSGSPAINGKGELVGLNFDRIWEGTMSDLNYDVTRCRNIMVDTRYILFIIDKFAGASHLIDEMEIIR